MYVSALKLKNFRNYDELIVEFNKGLNIIYGLNGQGKTNILEAIYFCATATSFRTQRTKEMIKWDKNSLYSAVNVNLKNSNKIIEIGIGKNEKKSAKVNKVPITKMEQLLGTVRVVSFIPQDLNIVNGAPAERRKFLDNAISQINPKYYRMLMNYNKTLNGRNLLLKQFSQENNYRDFLSVWDERLVEYGSYLIYWRNKFLKQIDQFSGKISKKLTNDVEEIKLHYSTVFNNIDNIDLLKDEFNNLLNINIQKDIFKRNTSIGPHRDDIDIFLGDLDVKVYGSQGQKRTAALSLKLSEIDVINNIYGEYPVVILDDVMSELDIKRQNYLLENFSDIQIIITCTHLENFYNTKTTNKSYFEVSRGTLAKKVDDIKVVD